MGTDKVNWPPCAVLKTKLIFGLIVVIMQLNLARMVPVAGASAVRTSDQKVSNVITEWNSEVQALSRQNSIPSQICTRFYALVHYAQFKTIRAAMERPSIDKSAAAAFAAHFVLSVYFPWRQFVFDQVLLRQVGSLNKSKRNAAERLGRKIAKKLVVDRIGDESERWIYYPPPGADTPVGIFRFAEGFPFALYPQLGQTKPFFIKNGKDFDMQGGPPEIGSPEYNRDYEQVKKYGAKDSTKRKAYDTETAYFWFDGAGTHAPSGHWFNITLEVIPKNTSLYETSYLFALIGVATYDANIAAWYQKWKYKFWRPIDAIRIGDPDHPAVADWTPLLRTPAYPDYPTCTATAAASARILTRYLGVHDVSFTIGSEGFVPGPTPRPLTPRHFDHIMTAVNEVGKSRIYGGVGYKESSDDGILLGFEVADHVFTKFKNKYPSS